MGFEKHRLNLSGANLLARGYVTEVTDRLHGRLNAHSIINSQKAVYHILLIMSSSWSIYLSKISKKDAMSLGVIIVVLVLLGAYFFFAPSAESPFGPVELNGGSITVSDQYQLDRVVLTAELVEAGWISIHESLSGAPAAVIGTSDYLEAGLHADLEIFLDTQMSLGSTYITLLHVDDGDQSFDLELDLPVAVNGETVRPDFVAQSNGEDDQDGESGEGDQGETVEMIVE